MKKLLTIGILVIVLLGCADNEIELPQGKNLLVVEGWITNKGPDQWIKISRTVGFEDSLSEEPVTNALVEVEDNLGNRQTFSHDSAGIFTTQSFTGIVNRRYRINITLNDGSIATSNFERLSPVSPIDTITYDFFIDQDEETGEDIRVYYPIVQSTDPVEQVNYYRYIAFRNGQKLNDPEDLFLLSDQFINGQTLPNEIPEFRYSEGDTIIMELHSLSQKAFGFLELLKLQTTSLGSSSGTSPASLVGNLSYQDKNDLILGFFGASAVSRDTTVVQ